MNRTELVLALEKHGLPVYGTDAELADRYDRNNLGKPAVAAKGAAVSVSKDGNFLLANRAGLEAPMTDAEKVSLPAQAYVAPVPISPRAHSVQTYNTPSDAPRKPGRPPKSK